MAATLSDDTIEVEGEYFEMIFRVQWIDTSSIEAGQYLVPIEIKSEKGAQFADLHLIVNDLEFALDCLREAVKAGIPDSGNFLSKALIFAGVVAYARAFQTTVRAVRLSPDTFKDVWTDENRELHTYLFTLRQKHIAHSVNDLERSDAVGIIVVGPDGKTRQPDMSCVGVILHNSIGLTKAKIDEAKAHIQSVVEYVKKWIANLAPEVHEEMKARLDTGGEWKLADVQLPDRQNVGKSRKT